MRGDPRETAGRLVAVFKEICGERFPAEAEGPLIERLAASVRAHNERSAAQLAADLEQQLQPVFDSIVALAALDFSRAAPVTGGSDVADAIAGGLNMLSDELQAHLARERELYNRLTHADRLAAVGQLSAGVAHEINNPATYIIANLEVLRTRQQGFAEMLGQLGSVLATRESKAAVVEARGLLAAAAASESFGDCANLIEESLDGIGRIVAIVKNLRTFARNDVAEDAPTDVDEVVRSVEKMAGKTVAYRARLVLDLNAGSLTMASAPRLTQVFLNLVVNASQAIQSGASRDNEVRVTTRREGEQLVVRVKDTGVGMTPEVQKKIFQPFFTTKPIDQGTGLGLSLSAEIIRQHGGEITFESAPGKGTTFTVRLPLRAPPATAPPPAAVAAPPPKARVLAIDDDQSVLKAYRRSLGRVFELTVASSGAEGLELIAAQPFDAVMCDVMMPGLDGPAVYEEVKRLHPDLAERFLFVSGGAFTDRTRLFVQAYPERVFEKPIDVAAMALTVSRFVPAGK